MGSIAKRLSVAAGLLTVALSVVATAAQAHDDDDYGWKKHKRYRGPVYVVPARPVYYYAGPPVMYAPPPVVYRAVPDYYPPPAPSLNINIPLR